MCLPHVLQIVIIRCGAAALDLSQDSSPQCQCAVEIRPGPCGKAILGIQYVLLFEAKFVLQEFSDDVLHRLAGRPVHMDPIDLSLPRLEMIQHPRRNLTDLLHLLPIRRVDCRANKTLVGSHGPQLRSWGVMKLPEACRPAVYPLGEPLPVAGQLIDQVVAGGVFREYPGVSFQEDDHDFIAWAAASAGVAVRWTSRSSPSGSPTPSPAIQIGNESLTGWPASQSAVVMALA